MGSTPPSYQGHRHPVETLSHGVWLHLRFPLSFREVEMLMPHAASASPTGPSAAGPPSSARPTRTDCAATGPGPGPGDTWHLDKVFMKINGEQKYL